MKRQRRCWHRSGEICWTTALLVCMATLQGMKTIEHGESFVFVTPPSFSPTTRATTNHHQTTTAHKRRSSPSSVASVVPSPTRLGAGRGEDPWALTAEKSTSRRRSSATTQAARKQLSSIADASYQLLDHKLLTKEDEYELGTKIRNFMDTKTNIEELIGRKKREHEQRKREIARRREKEADDRRKRRERGIGNGTRSKNNVDGNGNEHEDECDLSMEEELEEYLTSKGLGLRNNKIGRKANNSESGSNRHSIEELYGSFEEDEDEEAMMEQLGMAIYGIDYDAGGGDGDDTPGEFAALASDGFGVDDDDDDDAFSGAPRISDSSQLGDTLGDIRLLTEREIIDELGVEGGRKELVQILIQGALAKQQMIKSNVRLVTSIAKKWMGSSKGSGNSERNSDNERKLSRSIAMGDWSTPSMDEVIQQGIVGLAIAAERFEPERKFKFSTYATYYITNEVRNIFQSATTQCLYVPPYFYTIKNKYQKIVREHYRKTAGDPNLSLSMDQIADRLELKRERLEFILKSTQSLVQLDAPLSTGGTAPGKAGGNDNAHNSDSIVNSLPTEELSPEAIVEQSLLRQCLENALAAELLPLERDVVRLRHGLDDGKSRTVKEVMESCGGMLTLGDIRTVESRAYRKLRFKESVHNARLREFAAEYIGIAPELLETAH